MQARLSGVEENARRPLQYNCLLPGINELTLSSAEEQTGSMIICYIDDFILAIETVEEHFVRLRDVFDCVRDIGPSAGG